MFNAYGGAMKSLVTMVAIFSFILGTMNISAAAPKIKEKTVKYTVQGVEMTGYLAYDDSFWGKRPGVLVVHEWWGLNDYARMRARMLAELGYTAFAIDMYGGNKTAAHPEDAGKFSSELMKNFDVARARFTGAMELLKKRPIVDPDRIAAIGYCFGGGIVLNMARQGTDLKGVASFHGNLTPVKVAQPGAIKAKILVLNGADDKFTPPEQIEAFKREMAAANADYRFINYPGSLHSFTNPEADALAKKFNMPIAYNAEADKQSWEELKGFLSKIFKK